MEADQVRDRMFLALFFLESNYAEHSLRKQTEFSPGGDIGRNLDYELGHD